MHPKIETVLHGTPTPYENLDEQAARLNGYKQLYQQFSSGRFNGGYWSKYIDEDFSLHFESVNLRVNQRVCVPEDRYGICVFEKTSESQIINGEGVNGGNLVLLAPNSEFEVLTSDDMRILVIDIDKELVQENLLYQSLPVLHEASSYNAIISSNLELNNALLRTTSQLLTDLSGLTSRTPDGPIKSWRKEIATLALATFSNPKYVKTISQNVTRGRYRFEFFCSIRNHLDTQISNDVNWDAICDKFLVSRRYVETLFYEFARLTPARYLKICRLNEIRRTLLSDSNSSSSIGDIGARFGHWHESRLAQNYKELFRELPSETRARVRKVS